MNVLVLFAFLAREVPEAPRNSTDDCCGSWLSTWACWLDSVAEEAETGLKRQSNQAAAELEALPSWLPFSLPEGAAQVSGRDSCLSASQSESWELQ